MKLKLGVLADPALVGRSRELEELMQSLNSALEGKGTTVFVSGEAGSGKTKLVNEFLNSAKQKKDITTLTGLCLSNAAVPYLPFIEAFNTYFAEREGENFEKDELEISEWLTGVKQAEKGEKTGKYLHLSPQAWRDLTFAAITRAVLTMSVRKPVVLLIEDLHWADSASLSLLHFMARTLRSGKVLLLATFRSEELTTDIEGQTHPLAEELLFMRRENLLKEINLSNLSQDYVTEIATNMLGGSVGAEVTTKLAEESRGNALFVVESLRMLSERGLLHQEKDTWHLSLDTLGIPSKFKDIVLRRLSMLKFNQRRILDAASVIGERFDVDLLSAMLGQDNLEVLEALNSIARSTSLLRVEENLFMFDHAKSRQAIYEEIALPLKKGYHSRAAEKLESIRKDGKIHLSDVAYHYAQAGDEEKAVKFSLNAGKEALERFSNAEAVKHFAYVVEKMGDSAVGTETKSVALEGLGDAYYANCLYKKALEVFERLADSETGVVKLRAYRKAMDAVIFGHVDFPFRLVGLAKKAEPYAASSRLESTRIRFLSAPALRYDVSPNPLEKSRVVEAFESTLQVFEEEYSLPDIARALVPLARGLGSYAMLTHDYGSSVSALLRSIAMFKEMGDMRGLLDTLLQSGESFWWYGVLPQARDKLLETVQISERMGNYAKASQALMYLGLMSEHSGCLEEALSQTKKALEFSMRLEVPEVYGQMLHAIAARQYAKLGDIARAEEHYQKIAVVLQGLSMGTQEYPRNLILRDEIMRMATFLRTQAVLFAAKDRWKEANEFFEKCIELSKKPAATTVLKLQVGSDYAWALSRQGRVEEAKAQLEEVKKIIEEAEEGFARMIVDVSLIAPRAVTAGEEFEMRLDLVNVSKKSGELLKVEGLAPSEFAVTVGPATFDPRSGSVDFKGENIGSFQVVTVKLGLKALKEGTFNLSPRVTYFDESGKTKTCKPKPVTITVKAAELTHEILPNRVPTGYAELDALLHGGIPENQAVVLMSPASDERELLITRFLETGAISGEMTFYLTAEAGNSKVLAEKYPANFKLVLCNPQADLFVPTLSNLYKLKGVENLTEIDIELTKAFRTLNPSAAGSRRFCIGIVSDVLLQHHAVATRRWLSSILPALKSKGFTVLAVVNPKMHPSEEVQAVLGLFEGEIRIEEKETPQGIRQALRVRRLFNQKFIDSELVLDREKLEQ